MFDYGQSKASTASLFGAAFVHPVESLEDSFLMFFWDSDTGISDLKKGMTVFGSDFHNHVSVFVVVTDSVIAEIFQ